MRCALAKNSCPTAVTADAARGAIDEACAQCLLQVAHQETQRRLRQVHGTTRGGEAAFLDHQDEGAQLSDRHIHELSQWID